MRVGRTASAQLMETARVARFLQCRNSTSCIGIGIAMRTEHLAIVAASTCEPPPTQAEISAPGGVKGQATVLIPHDCAPMHMSLDP